jgi:fatty-acid peroxygenase
MTERVSSRGATIPFPVYAMKRRIPSDGAFDDTIALLTEGYRFVSNRCRYLGVDAFEGRVLFQRVVFMQGAEAARIFYDRDRFTRPGAVAAAMALRRGSLKTLDGDAHRRRKQTLMSLMTPVSIRRLTNELTRRWLEAVLAWERVEEVVLYDAVRELLCRSACAWAGVPLDETEVARRARDLGATLHDAVAPRTWSAIVARRRSQAWARSIVRDVRAGRIRVARDVPLGAIAGQQNEAGCPLDETAAAAELLDVLGPVVEIARLVTFAALALYEHMAHRDLEPGDEQALDRFVEEVRRFYPFSSVVTGLARTDFDWRGHDFRCGDLVMFDVYGTNHDPRIWTEPEAFDPNRFRSSLASAWAFIPQGGGSALLGHRCPGDRMTIEVLKQAVRLLTTQMRYEVPAQDIGVDLTRVPTLPRSGFVMKHVRRPEHPAAA